MVREKVLFVNAVNLGIPSGGKQVTEQIINDLKCHYDLEIINIYPGDKESSLLKFFKFFPAFVFRFGSFEFFEYLSKFSFYFIIQFLKGNFDVYKYIVFNHHQTFLYSLCLKSKCYFVIHDLVSLKNRDQSYLSRWLSIALETMLFSNKHLVFLSSDEMSTAQNRYRGTRTYLLDFFNHPAEFYPWDGKNLFIVGNFLRRENRLSVLRFLKILNDKILGSNVNRRFVVSVLGYNAHTLERDFKYKMVSNIEVILKSSFISLVDYRGGLHVAPLIFGAGVKIKVIDSYQAGIPTIGTKIAFQGIEKEIISKMGIKTDSIEEMCDFILYNSELKLHFSQIFQSSTSKRLKIEKILL